MPRLLDLFCCAGGATAGYTRAGFTTTGIDNQPRPNYPGHHIQADALEHLDGLILSGAITDYDLIHASPPCQEACALTVGTNKAMGWGGTHEQLIPALRRLLDIAGKPYVIEQPDGRAPVRKDLKLCGEMFGLPIIRHRNFELGGWTMPQPPHIPHRGRVRGWRHGQYFDGPYLACYGNGGGKATITEMQKALDIGWTDIREELTEAIPPAYTEHIGAAFLTR